jgi:iron complex transport system substrate-binding protein
MIALANVLALVLAFALSLAAFARNGEAPRHVYSALKDLTPATTLEKLPDGTPALRDRVGNLVPLKAYQRVASASTVADALLLEFAAPTQIAAFTQYHQGAKLTGHRYEGHPQIDAVHDMDGLLALHPDLLIVSTLASGVRVERLRETGLEVFVLGEMTGLSAYLDSALAISTLLDRRQLGQAYVHSFTRRMKSIAKDLPPSARKSALQLVYYGRQLYGSGTKTSYADVLDAAGLVDLGSQRFSGWPELSTDQVLALNPEVVVTRDGMGAQLCVQADLQQLRACNPATGQIVELPDELLNDPGPLMLPTAELIHAAVYER